MLDYWLGKGLDFHSKLQPDALQYGLKGGKARIALAGQLRYKLSRLSCVS